MADCYNTYDITRIGFRKWRLYLFDELVYIILNSWTRLVLDHLSAVICYIVTGKGNEYKLSTCTIPIITPYNHQFFYEACDFFMSFSHTKYILKMIHSFGLFELFEFYVTAVLFEDAVILGAATDAVTYQYKSPGEPGQAMHNLPFSTIERTVSMW